MSFKQFSANQSNAKADKSVKPPKELPEDKHEGKPEMENDTPAKP